MAHGDLRIRFTFYLELKLLYVTNLFIPIATQILTSPTKATKGSLVGYSAAGLPLYSFTGDTLHRTSQSVLMIIRNGLRQILEETDSRRIFYFLCVNLVG